MEAVTATGMLSLVVLGFVTNSISLTHNEKTADSANASAALALQKLEDLRSKAIGAPDTNVPGAFDDPANPLRADGTTAAGGIFTRRWTVSAANVPTNGVRTLTVTVDWSDVRSHRTTLAAYVRCPTIPCTAP